MSEGPRITRVSVYQYRTQTHDLGVDYNGFNSVYEPGAQREGTAYVLAIATDQGVTGAYAGGAAPSYAQAALPPPMPRSDCAPATCSAATPCRAN